jgi:fibronectin-binding autotransporter adhesin
MRNQTQQRPLMNPRILSTARLSLPLASAIAAMLGLSATPAAHAAARTWAGGSGDWETGQTGGFTTGPWANSDTATFNVSGVGAVTAKSAITTGNAALAFTLGNYTLQSDVATERVVTLGNDNVTLGNGVTTTIGSNVTLSRAAALTFDGNSTATSTLNINSGGRAINSGAAITIKEATANVNTGGTIQSDASLVVGNTSDGATLNVLGGTVTVGTGNPGAMFALGNTAANSPTVNFKITGGSLGFTDAGDSLAHSLRVGPLTPGAGVVTAIIDLEGGVVTVRGIYENKSTYSSTLNLHGGTLKALATTTDYIRVDNVWIKSGGAIFDSNGKSVTVTKDLLTDVFSSGGGLTLNDTAATKGTLTLSGASITYTGPTLVSAGKLVVPSTHAGTGAATVSATATLGVNVSGTSQWQPASLSLADPCTLEFNNVQNPGTTTAPLLPGTAVGTVTNVTININSIAGAATPGNSYPLVGQVSATNGYMLGTEPAGVTGHLAVDTGTLVYVVDSAADLWTGADGTNPTFWDIATTTNWDGKALINTPAGSYAEGDNVRFDDTATPASPVTVEIQAPVVPGNMTFANSSKNYIVNGSFAIGGSGTLTKTGSGTLTLSSSNSYSGGTNVSGKGALALAHGNAAGSGTINFASTSTSATIPTFSLSGGIDVTNAMILRADTGRNTIHSLGDNNTLSGNLTVTNNAGNIVLLSNYAAVGTTFTVGGATPNSTAITADTFSNSISFRCQTSGALGILNSRINAPNATVDANVNGNWTINSTGNSWAVTALLNGGIIKLGANDALATGAAVNLDGTGYVDLNGFNQTVAGLAGSGSTGKIVNDSTTSDSILTLAGLTADRNFIGAITDGTNGRITSLVMNSSGRTQTLSGANTYTGDTNVNAGTLAVDGDSIADTGKLVISGGIVNATGSETVGTLCFGATQQAAGTWGSSSSTAVPPFVDDTRFSGTGVVVVTAGPPAGGFSSWITGTFANGTVPSGQQGPNDDFDKDGINTLVEYAIAGQDPTVPNATVGTFTGNALSFSKRLDATGITYDIESSTLLTAESWTTLAKPPVVESASAISFTFTPGTPVKNFARLKVTQMP